MHSADTDISSESIIAMRRAMVSMRLDIGYTQEQLAEYLGLSDSTISRYETNRNDNKEIDPYFRCNMSNFQTYYTKLKSLHSSLANHSNLTKQ